MSRRLNFTNRHRIQRDEVEIKMDSQGGPGFVAELDLTRLLGLGVDPDAPVYIEAYHRTRIERFDHGVVGAPSNATNHTISQFSPEENVMFRVKIVEKGGDQGRILGLAKSLRPHSPEDEAEQRYSSLLPVKLEELGAEVFRVDFPEDQDGAPILLMNSALDDWLSGGIKDYARQPLFVSLVFPSAVRLILTRYLIDSDDGIPDSDEEDSARARWLAFAERIVGKSVPYEEEDVELQRYWVDQAVQGFANQAAIVNKFKSEVGKS